MSPHGTGVALFDGVSSVLAALPCVKLFPMRRTRSAVLFLPFLALSSIHAQGPAPKFRAGSWQIASIITLSTGQQTKSQNTVCVNHAEEFWDRPQPGLQCDAPTVTPVPGGYNVRLHCTGGQGPVQWKMETSIDETFSADKTSFQATGSTSTETTVPGQPPMHATAHIQSTGKWTGPCPADLKHAPAARPAGLQD